MIIFCYWLQNCIIELLYLKALPRRAVRSEQYSTVQSSLVQHLHREAFADSNYLFIIVKEVI